MRLDAGAVDIPKTLLMGCNGGVVIGCENLCVHLMLAAGSFTQWGDLSADDWAVHIAGWTRPLTPPSLVNAKVNGRLSLVPYEIGCGELDESSVQRLRHVLNASPEGDHLVGAVNGVPVSVALLDSGAERLARAGNRLVASRKRINEKSIDAELIGNWGEPDLVVACGPPNRSIPSLVWELAYSEIVYLGSPWRDVDSRALDQAIRAFHNRNRRFGGV